MRKYSIFDQLCALNYMCLVANHPAMLQHESIKRSMNVLNNR